MDRSVDHSKNTKQSHSVVFDAELLHADVMRTLKGDDAATIHHQLEALEKWCKDNSAG